MEGYIPCECDKSCFGETGKSMDSRKKEHNQYIPLDRTQASSVLEEACHVR